MADDIRMVTSIEDTARREAGPGAPKDSADGPAGELASAGPSGGSAFASFVSKHAAVVLTITTGVAYFMGVYSVSSFASELGVSPSDLGIDSRDYIVLALVPFIPVIAVAGGYLAAKYAWENARGRLKSILDGTVLILPMLLVLFYMLSSGRHTFFTVLDWITIGASFGLGVAFWCAQVIRLMWRTARSSEGAGGYKPGSVMHTLRSLPRWQGPPLYLLIWGLLILPVGLAIVEVWRAPREWASDLKIESSVLPSRTEQADPSEIDERLSGPFALELLLEPSLATVEVENGEQCVIRVGGKVILWDYETLIMDTVERAFLESCVGQQ